MPFDGFPADAFAFYRELETHLSALERVVSGRVGT